MTPEEKRALINEIKDRVKEELLLAIPDVIGNLMREQATMFKLNTKFYGDHPEFAKHKGIVRAVTESIEGDNLGMAYEEILKKAVPKIADQIRKVGKLDMESVSKPNRNLANLSLKSDHGEL